MPSYRAPTDAVSFLLNDVLGIEKYGNLPGFSDLSPDMLEAILTEGAKLCEEVLQPVNRSGDQQGCTRHADGRVTTPKGFREAYDAYTGGGWVGLSADPEYGGQGLPYTVGAIMNEFASSANMAFSMYPGLTMGAIAALHTHASEEIRRICRIAAPISASSRPGPCRRAMAPTRSLARRSSSRPASMT